MTKKEAEIRIEKLKKLINHHRYLYHVLDRQEISEQALDSLKKELFDLEQQFPDLITPDSPTQRVSGKPLEKFQKVKHPRPMLSFNDAFSQKDMQDWLERNMRMLSAKERDAVDFYCEPKLDGLAIELIYRQGYFQTGSTRGDGIFGEDVTQNLKTVEAIPLKLRSVPEIAEELRKERLAEAAKAVEKQGLDVTVRGEAIITKKEFEKVNREQAKSGLPLYANPRNLAAGSIRQLDPKITARRHLDSNVYELITDLGQKTHWEKHKILKALGFKTNNKYNKHCKNLEEVFRFHRHWYENRETLPYEIDGIVVMINDIKIFEELGAVGKAPRGAIAFKFPLKQSTSRVLDVKFQVGRTGAITPIAVLEPVELGGVTISRATLHNEDEIKRLGLKVGDTVIVGRAGDVIPDIIKVLPELRTGKEKNVKMPHKCPVCKTKLRKAEKEAILRCPNPFCLAKKRRYLYFFAGAFDMVGIGPKILDRLSDEGLISDPADLFSLKETDVMGLERFAEKSAVNLISAIQSKKTIDFPRFIYALGIRNVGEETASDLADYFGSVEKLQSASLAELEKITGVGPVVAESIHRFFSDKNNTAFIRKLEKSGVKILRRKRVSQKLSEKKFVLTGTLEVMSREKAKEEIRKRGGEVSESVSSKTDFLLAGKEPGSKYEKAKELNVKIIGEGEFLKMLD